MSRMCVCSIRCYQIGLAVYVWAVHQEWCDYREGGLSLSENVFWRICRRSGRSFVIQSAIFLIFSDCDVVRIELNELVDYEGLNLSNCSTGSCTTLWKLREIWGRPQISDVKGGS